MPEMTVDEIKEILPHRYPFLMIDRVLDYEPGLRATAIKNVSFNEVQFLGHIPGTPVMPGVLLTELMSQVGMFAILLDETYRGKLLFLDTINRVALRNRVVPGDRLLVEAECESGKDGFFFVSSKITIDGKRACEASLTLRILESAHAL